MWRELLKSSTYEDFNQTTSSANQAMQSQHATEDASNLKIVTFNLLPHFIILQKCSQIAQDKQSGFWSWSFCTWKRYIKMANRHLRLTLGCTLDSLSFPILVNAYISILLSPFPLIPRHPFFPYFRSCPFDCFRCHLSVSQILIVTPLGAHIEMDGL